MAHWSTRVSVQNFGRGADNFIITMTGNRGQVNYTVSSNGPDLMPSCSVWSRFQWREKDIDRMPKPMQAALQSMRQK